MRILVSKCGGTFRVGGKGPAGPRGAAGGEQGETEGLIRHLLREHDVCYFGMYHGEHICKVIQPAIKGLYYHSHPREQEERWRIDEERVKEFAPDMYITVMGYTPTSSFIANPRCTIVQDQSLRYTAPCLNIMRALNLPRIVVNNDPRTYPKDHEMTAVDKRLVPAALLDQCDAETSMVVGGKRYTRRSVHARCESWGYLPRSEGEKTQDVVVIAHRHVEDGCRQRGRATSWFNVLHGADVPVYGNGWNTRVLTPEEVREELQKTRYCPAVGLKRFYTGKVYVCEAQGCVPLLYGDGTDPHTWDHKGLFLPLDSPYRIRKPGDLMRLASELNWAEQREMWRELCVPHWHMLDNMINDYARIGTDWWFQHYGGYRA